MLLFATGCDINYWGDLDLGNDLYYAVEPTFNCIIRPVDLSSPYSGGNFVIQNIDSLGYNEEIILVESIEDTSRYYWVIYKDSLSVVLGFDDKSNMNLSNMHKISGDVYYREKMKHDIKVKSKLYYQKKAGYRK